jgi:ribonuclease E
MEMSRQRLKPALSEGSSIPCPRCGGAGHIRDTESSALQILRIIQEESMKDNTAAVHCQVPVEVASFLLNEKRTEIAKIELKQRVAVLMVPNKTLETPNYRLERLKHDDPRLDQIDASYKLAEDFEDPTAVTRRSQEPTNKQTPVIKGVLPDAPAPVAEPRPAHAPRTARNAPQAAGAAAPAAAPPKAASAPVHAAPAQEQGFFSWLKSLFGFGPSAPAAPAPVAPATPAPAGEPGAREPRRDGRGRRGERGGERQGERNGPREGAGREGGGDGRGRRGERNTEREARNGEARGNEGRPPRDNREGNRPRRDAEARTPQANDTGLNNAEAPQAAPADAGNNERAPRSSNGRRERGPRGEGRERQPRPAPEASTQDNGFADTAPQELLPDLDLSGSEVQDNTATEGGEPRQRRSRDRYGRNRRERGERNEQPGTTEAGTDSANLLDIDLTGGTVPATEPTTSEPPRRSYFAAAPMAAAAAVVSAEAQETPAPVGDALPTPMLATAPEVVLAPPAPATVPLASAPLLPLQSTGLPRVAPYQLPVQEMQQVAEGSGLQWVQSDADKVAAVQAAIAAEPRPIHVPRERPPVVVLDEGPLVLVETRRDLRDLQLPFEQEQRPAA